MRTFRSRSCAAPECPPALVLLREVRMHGTLEGCVNMLLTEGVHGALHVRGS